MSKKEIWFTVRRDETSGKYVYEARSSEGSIVSQPYGKLSAISKVMMLIEQHVFYGKDISSLFRGGTKTTKEKLSIPAKRQKKEGVNE